MKPENSEILNKYIHEMTRYMSYEDSKKAGADFTLNLKEKIGENPEEFEIIEYLNKVGNPYSISAKYESKYNILISGKNYETYNRLLKILAITIFFANVISYIKGYYSNVEVVDIVKVIIAQLTLVFVSLTLSFYIADRIKNINMLKSLMRDFSVNDLYNENEKKVRPSIGILIIVYSLMILVSMTPLKLTGNINLYTFLIIIFFFNILRDVSKLSESYYRHIVLVFMFISDIMAIIVIGFFINKSIITDNLLYRLTILLLISALYDFSLAIYGLFKEIKRK